MLSERDPAATPRRDSKCSRLGGNAPSCNQHKASRSRKVSPPLQVGNERERHHRQSSESSSRSSSSSRTSSSSSFESSDSDARRKKRKSKRHKRHKRHSMSQDSSFLNAPLTTMVPTPSRREVRRIKRGKYAHFEKLLSPLDDPSASPAGSRRARTCVRSATWLAGSMEHLRRYSGPDRSQNGTGAGEIPLHHLPAVFSVLRCSCPKIQQAHQAGCNQKPTISDEAAIPHKPTDQDIYWSINTPGSHNWQLPPQ